MRNRNTAAWRFQVWASFVIATLLMALGIAYLPVDLWTKGFMGMGLLFTIGSCFSLAKTIRDEHDAEPAPREERAHPFRSAV
jgi:hypothetical protein